MVSIRELEKEEKNRIKTIAELHKRAFPNFFLTQLGLPFLKTLYTGYLLDENSGLIVAEDDTIVGFLAYSNDYSQFYRNLIKKHLIQFAICSLGAVIKHPSFSKRILGAFKKSEAVKKDEKYVEISSICVDPKYKKEGIGSKLMKYVIKEVDFNTFSFINLETDADNNDEVNRFYLRNGFALERTYITQEGRRMNEYRYERKREN